MSDADLIFSRPPATSGDLIFGEAPAGAIEIDATLPGLTLVCVMTYQTNVSRPVVGQTTTSSQVAERLSPGVRDAIQSHLPAPASTTAPHQVATPAASQTRDVIEDMLPVKVGPAARHTEADKLQVQVAAPHSEMLRGSRLATSTRSQDGMRVQTTVSTSSQDRYRDRRPSVSTRSQDGVSAGFRGAWSHQKGVRVPVSCGARSQDAMRPPAGASVIVPPEPHVCYTPSAHLLFRASQAVNGALIFICDNHGNVPGESTVIVPVRRTYMVLNNVGLRRVTGNIELPASSMSITLDEKSWTFGFNAALPAEALPYLGRETDGSPALLEASVNGQAFLVLAEKVGRTRTFPQGGLRVSGRGKAAILDRPYAPVQQFTSTSGRTINQMMLNVLTANGVPLGWDVDFGLTDWFVPANTWAHQGTYISALNDMAAAGGGYLQPHPTDDTLILLPRYPTAPWEWGGVTPDFVLPDSVVTQESIDWDDKAEYNAVVVAGTTAAGILGNVTRDGSAGDLSAEMVTHPLITHVDAARQRGIAVLGDTGRQALVGLRLPVLPATGIILPGKFISYEVDGETFFGLSRSVSVQVEGLANVWQSITVETRA